MVGDGEVDGDGVVCDYEGEESVVGVGVGVVDFKECVDVVDVVVEEIEIGFLFE